MSRKSGLRVVSGLEARVSDMRRKLAAAERDKIAREAAFRRLHDRRHSLLDIEFSGGTRSVEQEAELSAILAQLDVLEAAEAIARGEFEGAHERTAAIAKVAHEMYAALRLREEATTGDIFDRLRFDVMKREHTEVLTWLERVTKTPGAWLTPREHFDLPGDHGGCKCPLHEARAIANRLKTNALGDPP